MCLRTVAFAVLLACVGCETTSVRSNEGALEESVAAPPTASATVQSPLPPLTPSPPRIVTLDGDVRVDVRAGSVSFPGVVALDEGWLEVGVCRAGTREHEAIVVTGALPSIVHAGMLLAGFESGRPGGYHENGASFAPEGDRIAVEIQPVDAAGDAVGAAVGLASTVVDTREPDETPALAWVFAGSAVLPNPASMGPGEYYAADFGGSIVGLSTFGDEVVAALETRSPDSGVDDAVWKIRPGLLPAAGTPVRVVLRRDLNPG